MDGEPVDLFWLRRRVKLRPLILILDVSGSMADYSRALLQFAHSAKRAVERVEVFCFGTRLTCVTRQLRIRDPEVLATAMERLSRLCHRVVWLNPHKGDRPDWRPQTLGMIVAAPHVDLVLSGHDLDSLEEFAELLPRLG
jgi:uncharacterized protein